MTEETNTALVEFQTPDGSEHTWKLQGNDPIDTLVDHLVETIPNDATLWRTNRPANGKYEDHAVGQ